MEDCKRLSQLVSDLQVQVVGIENYLEMNRLSPPSFDIDSPLVFNLPAAEDQARQNALDSIEQLQALLLGPLQYFMRTTGPKMNIFNALHAIHRFKIAQNLGITEIMSFEDLATRCVVDASDLKRFLRMAVAYRIFSEPKTGTIMHNALSKMLACMPGFHDWIGLVCEEMWPASVNCVPAISKWNGSMDVAHTGFALSNNSALPFFDIIGTDEKRAARFAAGMDVIGSAPMMNISYLVNNLVWTEDSCPKHVVDIGGSTGALAQSLLTAFTRVEECTVQDLPDVIRHAVVPEELNGRLKFVEYNFLHEQKIHGADCYILRQVLHDWPDKYAIDILRNQIPALKPGAMVIINEICLPGPGVLPRYQEQFLRGFDLSMKHINNGKERDREEWAALVREADSRFHIQRISTPAGSLLSVIEMVFESTGNVRQTP